MSVRLMTPPEQGTIQALLQGDEQEFVRLVAEHHAAFVRIARAWVRDGSTAEEVAQQAWLTALESLQRFEGRSSLRSWLYGILINIARAHARAYRRMIPFSALVAEEVMDGPTLEPERFLPEGDRWAGHWRVTPIPFPEPYDALERTELRATLETAIGELPLMQQQVLLLCDVQGLSSEEVCGLLELADTNRRVLLHRARSRLRAILERRFNEEESG